MVDAFRVGGWGMFPTLLAGLVFIGFAVRYAQKPHPDYLALLISLCALTLLSGALGFVTGLIATTQHGLVLEQAPIVIIGLGESLYNIALALVLSIIGTVGAAIGSFRRARPASPSSLEELGAVATART